MEHLRVVGSSRGVSGYARHTREFVRAFGRLGVAVELLSLDEWSPPGSSTTTLQFTMPTRTARREGERNVIYTMFEADRIPPSWAAGSAAFDRVVVPTAACREAWQRSGVASVAVAPLGVDAGYFATPVAPLQLSDRRVRFINVAELHPRKNHIGLLRAWIRATRRDDDAVLVLKVRGAVDRLVADVRDMEAALGRTLHSAAPVAVVDATLSDEDLRALYRGATHYLSLSHGEGWDLAAMEAAAAGLPLILPRHTAYAEIYRDEDVTFLPARAAPAVVAGRVGAEDTLLFEGTRWWSSDEDAAVEAIRGVIEGRTRERAPIADRLASDYSWDEAARRLFEVAA